ncbi:MAG TPA: TonB C-terminal domain-containing protein [Methylophilaceae bacterium]|nr:TonB C-terminal domain-containing protein [Methylophilaceae bacterium]
MIRKHENSLALKAGILALVVHLMFFLVLVMSFDWKSEMPLQVTEVELWDSLPVPQAKPLPPPPQPPEPPKPEVKVEDPPPPPPKLEEKAEIVVKEKKPEPKPEPKVEKKEPPKPDPAELKKKEELKKKAEEQKRKEDFRKLQKELLNDDLAQESREAELQSLKAARNAEQAQKAAVASDGVVKEFEGKIRSKIYSKMVRQPCGNAVPEYSISLMPDGHLLDKPKLVKSSGITACDDAAWRAIVDAQPLPLPLDPELFANFRDLRIPFKPEQ